MLDQALSYPDGLGVTDAQLGCETPRLDLRVVMPRRPPQSPPDHLDRVPGDFGVLVDPHHEERTVSAEGRWDHSGVGY